MKDIEKTIESMLLRPDATAKAIEKLCAEAIQHKFHGVCVNGCWVQVARHCLEETEVKVSATVGFPLGAMDADVKRYETEAAIDAGAQAIDMVLNFGRLKDGDGKFILRELRDVVEAADERPVTVILDPRLLSDDEKRLACDLISDSGAKIVQACTGFGGAGATVEDIKQLREAMGAKFGVKACGDIRDARTALALIEAGATRLGTPFGAAMAESIIAARADSN